ncbi:hypothetical protein O3P69_019315 [Scylla paramamosain]|uniref:Uncharacterized protein n=1 Tax=Scylla paramamosain TaxID=85552 RepID=A0AAW0SV95_SCYPA
MSLIRIRGCTILGPILSEEERAAARVLRERAIRTQYELRQGFQSQHSSSSSGRGAVKPHDTTVRHASTSTSTSCHEDDSTASTTTTTTTAATTSTDPTAMTSLIEMDRALLLSSSPDIATDIILGRRHPSSILPRPATTSPTHAPRPDPQDPQEPQSTSVSLSFPSASDGAEGMEELLDGSEEGAGSLPSEVESSDSHVDETPRGVGRAGQQGQRGYRGGVFEAPQRDSGRSSSHSDYLDDYLEQLTRRCSTGLLGLEASTAARTSVRLLQLQNAKEKIEAVGGAPGGGQQGSPLTRPGVWEARILLPLPAPGDPADLPPAPPLAPPCSPFLPRHPHPSSFSSHQEYLDSYLGHLTDDAWLQFPSRLSSRRLIYLSSSDYFASVRKSSSSPSSSSASCPSTSHNGTGSGQEGAQSTDAPSRTPVSPRDPQTDLQSAPVTPPDKAKVSSDEGH